MRNLRKSALGLLVIGMWLGVSAPAQAASAVGPYYATPSWDQKLDANARFIVLLNWNSAAVLDRETGLVWERDPSDASFTWLDAQIHCNTLTVGGRQGWRLPTLQELTSLVDGTSNSNPMLPAGHPFVGIVSTGFWSATTAAVNPGIGAWLASLTTNPVVASVPQLKTQSFSVWCVRGGQGVDPQ